MSEDENGFLARWSQRKRAAVKAEPEQVAADEPSPVSTEAGPAEAEPPFDLESLPKLEELTANTDMTVFFKKGVPESIRNAALRQSWALDPAIRNYVNPALDYAYDWNTPGGVPGGGELAPGTDIARMVSQIMGDGEQPASLHEAVDKHGGGDTRVPDDVAENVRQADAPSQSVRLSDAGLRESSGSDPGADHSRTDSAAPASGDELVESQDDDDGRAFASQQNVRRHGSARPK